MRKPTDLQPDDMAVPSPRKARSAAEQREDRLKAALKANMARRKAQAKARSAEDGGSGGSGQTG